MARRVEQLSLHDTVTRLISNEATRIAKSDLMKGKTRGKNDRAGKFPAKGNARSVKGQERNYYLTFLRLP